MASARVERMASCVNISAMFRKQLRRLAQTAKRPATSLGAFRGAYQRAGQSDRLVSETTGCTMSLLMLWQAADLAVASPAIEPSAPSTTTKSKTQPCCGRSCNSNVQGHIQRAAESSCGSYYREKASKVVKNEDCKSSKRVAKPRSLSSIPLRVIQQRSASPRPHRG